MEPCDFGYALRLLKAGKRVARSGWNGKGMWIGLVHSGQWGLGSGQPYDSDSIHANLLPWVGMKTADGSFVPWLCSQTDMLACDWGEVD